MDFSLEYYSSPNYQALPESVRKVFTRSRHQATKHRKERKSSTAEGRKNWALSYEEFAALYARSGGRCEVSYVPFDSTPRTDGRKSPRALSIDRKDPTKCYSYDNCRLVCYWVNTALNQWGDEELRYFSNQVVSAAKEQEDPSHIFAVTCFWL